MSIEKTVIANIALQNLCDYFKKVFRNSWFDHKSFFIIIIFCYFEYNFSAFFTHLQVQEIPGIMIFHSSATLYFANAEMYIDALYEKVVTHKHHTHIYSQAYSFTHIYIKSNYKTLLTTGYYPKHSSNINIHCVISPKQATSMQ